MEGLTRDGATMKMVHEVRDRLKDSHGGWDDLWKDGLTPWDLGQPTPVLIDELQKQRGHVSKWQASGSLRTLVPGCGSGYDIVTLVDHHDAILSQWKDTSIKQSVVIGLDISPTSLDKATSLLKAQHKMDEKQTSAELKCGDFFADPSKWNCVHATLPNSQHSLQDDDKFDFIYDYTFFCALPPSLRPLWGKQMGALLRPNTGRMLTVMFPILPGEDVTKGPPYPVTIDDYREVLEPMGIVMELEPFESPHTVASRAGKELLCYWCWEPSESRSPRL